MADEEQRPVHHIHNVATGETESIPVTDEEWEQIKQGEKDNEAARLAEQAEEEALREAVLNHSDPVVKALGKKLGIV